MSQSDYWYAKIIEGTELEKPGVCPSAPILCCFAQPVKLVRIGNRINVTVLQVLSYLVDHFSLAAVRAALNRACACGDPPCTNPAYPGADITEFGLPELIDEHRAYGILGPLCCSLVVWDVFEVASETSRIGYLQRAAALFCCEVLPPGPQPVPPPPPPVVTPPTPPEPVPICQLPPAPEGTPNPPGLTVASPAAPTNLGPPPPPPPPKG